MDTLIKRVSWKIFVMEAIGSLICCSQEELVLFRFSSIMMMLKFVTLLVPSDLFIKLVSLNNWNWQYCSPTYLSMLCF